MSETNQKISGDKEKGDGLAHISAVANYFIERSNKEGRFLSNLSIQKLVYFAYGWVMVDKREKLFYDRIEAWQYGPVIPSLYHQLKRFGRGRISERIMDYDHDENKFYYWYLIKDTPTEKFMRKVWDHYKSLSPGEMVDRTHKPRNPMVHNHNEQGV